MRNFSMCAGLVLAWAVAAQALELPDSGMKEAQTIKSKEELTILPNGDILNDLTLTLPVNEYNRVRRENVNAYRFVRDLKYQGATIQTNTKVTNDDATNSYRIVTTVSGGMKHSERRWEGQLDQNYDFVSLANNTAAFSMLLDMENGFRIQGQSYVKLPEGAADAKWDATSKTLSYVLPDGSQGMGSPVLLGLTALFALGTLTFGLCWLVVKKP